MTIVQQYLDKLPEPYRTQALNNYSERYIKNWPSSQVFDVSSALRLAFHWASSDEGAVYWNEIYNRSVTNNLVPDYRKYLKV